MGRALRDRRRRLVGGACFRETGVSVTIIIAGHTAWIPVHESMMHCSYRQEAVRCVCVTERSMVALYQLEMRIFLG